MSVQPERPSVVEPKLSKYDASLDTFVAVPNACVLGALDFFNELPTLPRDSFIFARVELFDVQETAIRALYNLTSCYPACHVVVFNSPRVLQHMAEAKTASPLIVDLTLPPDEVPDKEQWRQSFATKAFAAGCAGALVTEHCLSLARENPAQSFFKMV